MKKSNSQNEASARDSEKSWPGLCLREAIHV